MLNAIIPILIQSDSSLLLSPSSILSCKINWKSLIRVTSSVHYKRLLPIVSVQETMSVVDLFKIMSESQKLGMFECSHMNL